MPGILTATGRCYYAHLSKRSDRKKAETRHEGGEQGWSHLVMGHMDAEGGLICERGMIVHVSHQDRFHCVCAIKGKRQRVMPVTFFILLFFN